MNDRTFAEDANERYIKPALIELIELIEQPYEEVAPGKLDKRVKEYLHQALEGMDNHIAAYASKQLAEIEAGTRGEKTRNLEDVIAVARRALFAADDANKIPKLAEMLVETQNRERRIAGAGEAMRQGARAALKEGTAKTRAEKRAEAEKGVRQGISAAASEALRQGPAETGEHRMSEVMTGVLDQVRDDNIKATGRGNW